MVGVPFVVAVPLRPPSAARRFRNAGIHAGQRVPAAEVDLAVLLDQSVDLFGSVVGQDFAEEIDQVTADETLEVFVGDGRAGGGIEHLLDRAADVLGGVQQGAVNIEQVNRELAESRRLRTLPFRQSGNAASAVRPDHLLRMVLGVLRLGVRRQAAGRR